MEARHLAAEKMTSISCFYTATGILAKFPLDWQGHRLAKQGRLAIILTHIATCTLSLQKKRSNFKKNMMKKSHRLAKNIPTYWQGRRLVKQSRCVRPAHISKPFQKRPQIGDTRCLSEDPKPPHFLPDLLTARVNTNPAHNHSRVTHAWLWVGPRTSTYFFHNTAKKGISC